MEKHSRACKYDGTNVLELDYSRYSARNGWYSASSDEIKVK